MFGVRKAALFDLDGVIVDTAKYHYLAWGEIANSLGFNFSKKQNEKLKCVSRRESLEILLSLGGINVSEEQKQHLMNEKNKLYIEYINKITAEDILEGSLDYILNLKDKGIKIGLGSASKNDKFILLKLGIINLFDVIIDGTCIKFSKPDPEVFLLGVEGLKLKPEDCVVFEDSQSGIEAAKNAGMYIVGIGDNNTLQNANIVVKNLNELLNNENPCAI